MSQAVQPKTGQKTILIGGSNGGNVDTMVLVHIDEVKKTVTLLSVPRDLFYNGRKINSAYALYGMAELERELEEITGYPIDHYVLIDMYAFIEVVDAIGGVDVTLDTAVIDPSYKTFDNGEWGTLYYEAGEHHLNGTQALRIARTRHTTSDFERAKRQHLILQAIKDKLLSSKFTDAARLQSLVQIALGKTKTDLQASGVLSLALRFKSFKVKTGYVLDTTNVLQSRTLAEKTAEEPDEKCYKQVAGTSRVIEITCPARAVGQYILIPRTDWKAIQDYVKKVFGD